MTKKEKRAEMIYNSIMFPARIDLDAAKERYKAALARAIDAKVKILEGGK